MLYANENKIITINGIGVPPGAQKLLKIEIARLPSGTLIDIPVHVFNGKKAGPTVLVQAGLHGDEINGTETLRRMHEKKEFSVKRGAIIVVPILNIFGFIHFSRDVPDGKDVNRSFPGNKLGSLASRIAYNHAQQLLPHADICIDLHTGGGQRENVPQIRFSKEDEQGQELAKLFNAPFYFPSKLINGSFRKEAFKRGKATIVYEGGESMRFDEYAIETAREGILNVLRGLKMLTNTAKTMKGSAVFIAQRKWIRAPRAGMFIPEIANGSAIVKGQVLGKIADTFANKSKQIKAPMDGFILCTNHQAVVNRGDALFNVGR